MPIQQRHVDELKRIYRQQYSEQLTDKEAWAMANRLVTLFKTLTSHGRTRTPESDDS